MRKAYVGWMYGVVCIFLYAGEVAADSSKNNSSSGSSGGRTRSHRYWMLRPPEGYQYTVKPPVPARICLEITDKRSHVSWTVREPVVRELRAGISWEGRSKMNDFVPKTITLPATTPIQLPFIKFPSQVIVWCVRVLDTGEY
ncbi:hypothetical protein Bbelb_205050 [Branchiostoma belcheri]|nr:hypothetical protein Bbelb_205050 [Branchiostoma belcheri]